jgi:hypothetical protein
VKQTTPQTMIASEQSDPRDRALRCAFRSKEDLMKEPISARDESDEDYSSG